MHARPPSPARSLRPLSFAVAIAGAMLCGCAAAPPAARDVAAAGRAIDRAVEAGAAARAPRELALAREKVMLSHGYARSGDFTPVRWLAQQAEVDARLARLKSLSAP